MLKVSRFSVVNKEEEFGAVLASQWCLLYCGPASCSPLNPA